MQVTTFPYEIIIGEDESSDGTREICLQYAEKYPDRIRLFLRSRKDVIFINGKPTGRYNFIQNIASARGKYIALLPGDDFWTDPMKLQKQVNILEANPDYVASHHWHRVAVKNDSGDFEIKEAPQSGHGYYPEQATTVADIFANRVRIKSRTVLFRNIFLNGFEFPEWFRTVQFGDVALSMIIGKFGQFHFMDEEMAVYRMTGSGVSTMGNKHYLFLYHHYLAWIRIWELGDEWFGGNYRRNAVTTIRQFYGTIYKRYDYSFRVFTRSLGFALFRSHLSLFMRLKMAGSLIILWLQKSNSSGRKK